MPHYKLGLVAKLLQYFNKKLYPNIKIIKESQHSHKITLLTNKFI